MSAAVVALHGARVGILERLGDDEDHEFRFDQEWVADPERSVLGQLFEDRRPRTIQSSGMLAWFAHLLPPWPLRRHLSRWAGLDDDAADIDLLLAMGADLPGALTLEPVGSALTGRSYAAVPPPTSGAIGFGLPGAQWKLSIRRGERGLVVPVRGSAGEYIAKFHDPAHAELPRVEFATTRWARLCGLRTHDAQLVDVAAFAGLPLGVPTGDGKVFLAARFDRAVGGARVHAEDFGQISGGAPGDLYHGSYEQLAALVGALTPTDVGEFLDRLAFAILSGNGDAHWKNWGVVYPDRRNPRLSQAYDLVSTVVYEPTDELALSLAGSKSFSSVDTSALSGLAAWAGWPSTTALPRLRRFREAAEAIWAGGEADLPFGAGERERISAHLARIPKW